MKNEKQSEFYRLCSTDYEKDKLEERDLINKILSGDQRSFKTFIENYKNLVAHITFKMIDNPADREDICQDVFINVYRNLAQFQFNSKVSTWVAKITYNICINHLRKKRPELISSDNSEDVWDSFQGDAVQPDKFASQAETSDIITSMMNKLPETYRTLLTLYHIEGMSYREIGEITELPEGTVKSYIFRARKQLKDCLLKAFKKDELNV